MRTIYCWRSFTLLELLVVMLIIGVLASYVIPSFFSQVGKFDVKAKVWRCGLA